VVIRLTSKVKRERVITRHMGNLKEAAPAMLVIILVDHSICYLQICKGLQLHFTNLSSTSCGFIWFIMQIRLERQERIDYSVCGLKKRKRRNYTIKVWTLLAIYTYVVWSITYSYGKFFNLLTSNSRY
jgi:hypothetical protein